MDNYSKTKKVDRLAIVVLNSKTEKILSIPPLENGTGFAQVTAITEVIIMVTVKLIIISSLKLSQYFLGAFVGCSRLGIFLNRQGYFL